MKRGKFVVCCALAAVAAIAAGACTAKPGDSEKAQFTVTFRQSGYEDVIKFSSGGAFDGKEIPATQSRTGYTVTWEEVDFSNVRADVVVNAVETPNEYTITYVAGDGATVSPTTQKVTYDSQYTLVVPEREDGEYTFGYWKYDGAAITNTGVWKIAADVTLTAEWIGNAETYTVTFVQNGQEAITRQVTKGGELTDIPAPQPKTGYTVTWDRTDFSNVSGNLTVNAVETPNEYTITYDLENKEGATISSTTQTVTYDAPYNLYQPTCEGYTFSGWKRADNGKTFENGTYTLTENITLIAVWEEEEEESWTKFY